MGIFCLSSSFILVNFHKDFASDILREAANFMNKKSTASGVSVMPRKYFKKHKASTKMVAVSLAFLMVFSALSANVASVVKLLDVKAASTDHDESDYYESTLTLYDYHTDDQLKYGINRNDGYALGADNLNS